MYSDNIKSVLRSLASSGSVGKQERVSRLFKSYNPHKSQLKSYNPHQSQQRSEFRIISSEVNEVCSKEQKTTIAPEHVLKALQAATQLEFLEDRSDSTHHQCYHNKHPYSNNRIL